MSVKGTPPGRRGTHRANPRSPAERVHAMPWGAGRGVGTTNPAAHLASSGVPCGLTESPKRVQGADVGARVVQSSTGRQRQRELERAAGLCRAAPLCLAASHNALEQYSGEQQGALPDCGLQG